jgi:hypothetical protein
LNTGWIIHDRLAENFKLGGFPQLEVFILGDKAWPICSPKEELKSFILPLVELRRKTGKELVRFDVHWSDGWDKYAINRSTYLGL